eukprot:6467745-Amphidinium_carterae.1
MSSVCPETAQTIVLFKCVRNQANTLREQTSVEACSSAALVAARTSVAQTLQQHTCCQHGTHHSSWSSHEEHDSGELSARSRACLPKWSMKRHKSGHEELGV